MTVLMRCLWGLGLVAFVAGAPGAGAAAQDDPDRPQEELGPPLGGDDELGPALGGDDPADDPTGAETEAAPEDPVRRPAEAELGDTVVTATRGQRRDIDVPMAVSSIDAAEIQRRLAPGTPDALQQEVGVVIQRTNLAGGSPILRGRSGKDVLLLMDGRRFNTSTFRRNNQYLNTIGLSAVERLEVVRGPASVLYGSDAMGGAINVITRRREPRGEDGLSGRLYGQYETATQGYLAHIGLEGEYAGTGFTAGFTRRFFDDLRAGSSGSSGVGAVDRNGRQKPTGFDEYDFDLSLSRRISDNSLLDFLYIHTRQEDVPRSDRLIANDKQPVAPDLRRDFHPQILRWFELRYRYEEPGETLESFQITATFLNPEETRRRVRTNDPGTLITERDRTGVPGLSSQFHFRLSPEHRLTTGFDADYEWLDSSRTTRDLGTGVLTPSANGRYPDDAVYQSYGLYAQDEWTLSDRWRWTNGARYSYFRTRYDLGGVVVGPLGPFGRQSETYDDVTFASSLHFQCCPSTAFYASIARGFRAPNLDDLAVLGDFSSGERVPSTDLDPETVWNFELGVKHQTARTRAGGAVALAQYRDLFDNEFLFSQGGDDFFQVTNRSRARIFSLEGWFERVLCESDGETLEHVLFGNGFATWGRDLSSDDPVRRIPPAQGELGWRVLTPDDRWSAEVFARGAMDQDRLSDSDEADPRIPIDGSKRWLTWNLRGSVQIDEETRLTAALENLLDQRYRVHGSGIDAPGFNAVLALDWRF